MQILSSHGPAVLLVTALAIPAPAMAFLDDFQDGDTAGWRESTDGGLGSYGVQSKNDSLMAYVQHTGDGSVYASGANWHSLSRDFSYDAAHWLSFEMLPVASGTRGCCSYAQAKAGVTITFLDIFNIALGSAGLYYTTSTSILAPGEVALDAAVQRHYEAPLTSFASLAGLPVTAPIARVSLTFKAYGQWLGGGNIYPTGRGSGTVWFDNVQVSAVPEPASAAMLLAGMAALVGMGAWRQRALRGDELLRS